MKIAKLEAIPLQVPFSPGGPPSGWEGTALSLRETVLVRVETDNGLVGWGEAFSYNCSRPVQAAIEDMAAPLAVGRDAADVAGLMRDLQQRLHLFGRYGITMFALSGLDIALWDLAAKAAGLPLNRLLGNVGRHQVPGYASLVKYRDPGIVAERTGAALAEGYGYIKLHETTEPEVRAARETAGPAVPIMLDCNCPWTPSEAETATVWLKDYDLHWLEEPIFPPEDFRALAELRMQSGIPIAAGENACTAFEFQAMFAAGAVTYAQPSVTKVGGITEFLKVAALADNSGVALMPHSPYFGPGFLATLHLLAALPGPGLIERLYVTPEASAYGGLIDPSEGSFRVPEEPGLGPDPDPDFVRSYALAAD